AGVNEADGGRVASSNNSRVTYAVKATVRSRQGSIHGVGFVPGQTVVPAAAPLDTESPRISGVGGSHPGAFLTANLPERKLERKGVPEAHLVHTADNSQARFFVRPQTGLSQKPSSAARLSHSLGVKANSLLAAPSDEATALS